MSKLPQPRPSLGTTLRPDGKDMFKPRIGISRTSLVMPRWLAVVGQTLAVLIVHFWFGFNLPLFACLATIGGLAVMNIWLHSGFPPTKRFSDREAALFLGIDMLQLTALLYFTGGLHNPFFILFIAPVAVSASSLSMRSTIILMLLGFACVSIIALFAQPLPWIEGQEFEMPRLYQVGLWVAIILGLSFSTAYASGIAREARAMSTALAASQYVLAREQRLSAVGGLAAAAAHELGTPLGTIALIAKEFQEELGDRPELKEDLDMLMSQVHRCRDILSRLSANPSQGDAVYDRLDVSALIHEVVDQMPHTGVHFDVNLAPFERAEDGEEPNIARQPEILYGLGNFIDNAADFAKSRVSVTADWNENTISLRIADDGPGFPSRILESLGEPFLTTRLRETKSARGHDHEGLGLGVFIAKTLIEHTGGTIRFANSSKPGEGAVVTVTWARADLEA
ncbi:MAG: HAMP domain-containing histidine kinase [Alphaproteobacteria bacterium]|nr:MAG: HAMP domain-containing histidine kinase [Alphaproteobacteria bacterium]